MSKLSHKLPLMGHALVIRLRVVARENVHISQYPTPKNETRADRKTSKICRQKSALERAQQAQCGIQLLL